MLNTFRNSILHNICNFISILSITFVSILPFSRIHAINIHQQHPAIMFMYDEAMKISHNRIKPEMSQYDVDKIINIMIYMKYRIKKVWEFEIKTGQIFDRLKKEIKKNNIDIPKKYIRAFKRRYEEADRAYQRKYGWQFENNLNCSAPLFYNESRARNSKDNRPDEDNIPPSLAGWLTFTLIGVGIIFLPLPEAKKCGMFMVSSGLTQCYACISAKQDEDWKKQKELEKKQKLKDQKEQILEDYERQKLEDLEKQKIEEKDDCSICGEVNCPYHEERKREREY